MMKKHSDKVIPAVFIGALLLIWELCVRIFRIPLYVLPSPVSVVQALIEERVGLWGHAVVTTEEALIGIGIALILSLALGVLMDCFPALLSGLKVSATYSISGAVVGEWIGSQQGLGYYLLRVKNSYVLDKVFACVVVIIALSLCMNGIIRLMSFVLLPYERRKR